jgi:hypothetical protein
VIATEWDAFRALDFRRLKAVMEVPILIDLRNIYPASEVEKAGFRHVGVGRPREDIERQTNLQEDSGRSVSDHTVESEAAG